MDKNKDNIAVSALYTSGTWHWAGFPGAALLTPPDALRIFRLVNAYLVLYRWLNPRTYSLRHQLLHRHCAIDRLLTVSGCRRVIEVASGLSPRGLRYSADPALQYTEIDLPDMVGYKRARLEAEAAGREVLARPNLKLRAGDVLELDFAAEIGDAPTAVITEGLMMYFGRQQQLKIWRSIAQLVTATDGVYLFDYIPLSEEPPRSLPGRLLHALKVRVFGVKTDFMYDERDRDGVAADLRAAGFAEVASVATGEVAQAWGFRDPATPSRTLVYCCGSRARVSAMLAAAASTGSPS